MGEMRVISGKAGGLKLKTVSGDSTRPITDRVKESVFNILGTDVVECNFFDVFAGTGAIAIEALSRGAAFARLIDINHEAIKTIKLNLAHTRLEASAEVIQSNALKYLDQQPDRTFEIIYVAPPQYKEIWLKTMQILDSHSGWLTDEGCIIVQIHPVEYKPLDLTRLVEVDQRKYGSTLLVFYEKC